MTITTPSCCSHNDDPNHINNHGKNSKDWFLLICAILVFIAYVLGAFFSDSIPFSSLSHFSHSVVEFVNTMWWGVLIGMAFLGILSKTPREFIMAALGSNKGLAGICRATMAGVLLDLCSHGILMVGAKLYERGATIGQVIAFLIASPWNSFSMTIILIALIGLKWTIVFILLSLLIAIISGLVFDKLVSTNVLPANTNHHNLPDNFDFWHQVKKSFKNSQWSLPFFKDMAISGIKESRIVIRWLLFGILLASALRMFLSADDFSNYFGPTLIGLSLTVLFASVLEVCSEGSAPIASDLFNRGGAIGNAFAFLMAGVSTDYTEVVVLKEVTKSWKIALFLPLITLPQIILLAVFLNSFS